MAVVRNSVGYNQLSWQLLPSCYSLFMMFENNPNYLWFDYLFHSSYTGLKYGKKKSKM